MNNLETSSKKKRFGPVLNNPDNLPQSARDEKILKLVRRNRRFEFLKVLGGPNLKADFYRPFLDNLVRSNRITVDEGNQFEVVIRNGAINQSTKDGLIGATSHWAVEKAIQFFWVSDWAYQTLPQEAAHVFNALFFTANFTAVPYFGARALWEYGKIKSENRLEKHDGLILIGSVVLNAVPVASALTTPLLNYNRFRPFFRAVINDHLSQIKKPFASLSQAYKEVVI